MHNIEIPNLLLAVLFGGHFIVSCGLAWRAFQDGRNAILHWQDARRWQALAEALLVRKRSEAAPTIVAPAWHAPRSERIPSRSAADLRSSQV